MLVACGAAPVKTAVAPPTCYAPTLLLGGACFALEETPPRGRQDYGAVLTAATGERIALPSHRRPILAYAEGTDGLLFATGAGELFTVTAGPPAEVVEGSFHPEAGLVPVAGRGGPATFLLTNEHELVAVVDRTDTRKVRPRFALGDVRQSHLQASWSAADGGQILLRWYRAGAPETARVVPVDEATVRVE